MNGESLSMKAKKLEKIETLKKNYPYEWLLIGNCEVDRSGRPVRGVLLEHSRSREVIYQKLRGLKGKLCVEYAADLPEETEVLFIWVA